MTKLRHDQTDADALADEMRRIQELTRTRRHGEALTAARAVLRGAPSHRAALYLSAMNARLLDLAMDALDMLNALEQHHPHYSLLFQERGYCQLALGDAARAIAAFERAVELNPGLASSWALLQRLLAAAGERQKAAVAAQQLAKLNELPPAIVEAGSWFCDGLHAEAEALLTRHIERRGRHVEALRLLGRIAQRRGAAERAELLLREVMERAPGYGAARLDFVRVLIERQAYAAALQQVDGRLSTAPSDPEAQFLRATILAGLGRHDDAIPIFRALLAATPQRHQLRIVLGHSLRALGRTDEAVQAYRDATSGQADRGDAYWSLANLKTYRFSDDEVARLRCFEAQPCQPDQPQLCFALGKALEDRGDHAKSWAFYTRGNALVRSSSRYQAETIEDNIRLLMEVCSAEFFAARQGSGTAARDPIFIVGLPRSGSTLLEQILAAHRDVDGTQELNDIPRIVADLHKPDCDARPYPHLLPGLDPRLFERLGRQYLDDTQAYRRGQPRFIDKMPNNFRHIGLIQLMLPQAVIIDVRREPMACCVSNLKQFYAKGQEFCYGIDDIARYYRSYLDLMRHWDRVLPGRVLRVSYEDLVEHFDRSVRRILDYCGLDFDPACLAFHRSRRAISTPSSEQVRQPLYRDGLSQWRHFAPWLDSLRQALGDAVDRYRD